MGSLNADLGRTDPTTSRSARAEFANRVPAFLWGFAVFWYAMVGAFTWLIVRDGPPPGPDPALVHVILALFWLAGIAVVSLALAAPCVRVVVSGGGIEVISRFPHRTVRDRYRAAELLPAEVADSTDSDGDPYHSVIVRVRRGGHFTLHEGHHRPSCEDAARRFNRAAGLTPPVRR